jgi:hypothetical protein
MERKPTQSRERVKNPDDDIMEANRAESPEQQRRRNG